MTVLYTGLISRVLDETDLVATINDYFQLCKVSFKDKVKFVGMLVKTWDIRRVLMAYKHRDFNCFNSKTRKHVGMNPSDMNKAMQGVMGSTNHDVLLKLKTDVQAKQQLNPDKVNTNSACSANNPVMTNEIALQTQEAAAARITKDANGQIMVAYQTFADLAEKR